MDNMDAARSGYDPAAPLPPSGIWTAHSSPPVKKPRNPAFWAGTKVSLLFLGSLLVSVILSVILLLGSAVLDGVAGKDFLGDGGGMLWLMYDDVGYQVMTLIVYAIPFLLAGGIYMAASRLSWKTVMPADRVPAGEFFMAVWVVLFFGLLGSYFTPIVERILASFGLEPAELSFDLPYSLPGILLFGISIAILPPLLEEFMVRGLALQTLKPLGHGPAILLSALLFGLIHGTVQQLHLAVFMGLAAAFFTLKYNNIWIGVTAHFINNGASFALSLAERYLTEEANFFVSMGAETLLILPGFACIAALLMKKEPGFSRLDDSPFLPKGIGGVALNPATIALVLIYAGILLSGLQRIGG